MIRFAFIIAIDDKTLFRRIENHHTQEISSLVREVRDDKEEKTANTTKEERRGIQDFS